MLKDRRALLEQDLSRALSQAADMYLDIVTHDGDVASVPYQDLKDKIESLKFDLNIVNHLIDKGAE
jgi:hypothetical protein